MSNRIKKNCHNCKHGGNEADGEYGEINYFTCDKRYDDGKNKLDENLEKESYLEKAKVCCDPMVEVECKDCGEKELAHIYNINFQCFVCWVSSKKYN